MTVIPVHNSLIDETDSAVKLARYAQIIGLSEDQFFGIANPTTSVDSCNPIWTLRERQRIARYLAEAQTEIEQVVGYPLTPRWIEDEQKPYPFDPNAPLYHYKPIFAKWGKIIEIGYWVRTMIHAGIAPSYAADPATFSHATTVTDEAEIHIYHPGTAIEIYPSSITIAAGTVTVEIPWARLVKLASQDNPSTGLTYATVPPAPTSIYEATVDLMRKYNDTGIQGGLFWHHRSSAECTCGCSSCCDGCGEYDITACITISNSEIGTLELSPADVSNGVWSSACDTCFCEEPDVVKMNYRAGETEMTAQIEDAVIRLAHSKMPSPPCGCGVANEYWTRDREIPDVMTPEQANCSFGQSRGAFFAWKQALALKLQRGFSLG